MLTGADQELMPILQDSMSKLGLECRLASPFDSVEKTEDGMLQVNLADGNKL